MTSVGKTFCLAIPYRRIEELNKKEKGLAQVHSDVRCNLDEIIKRLENVDRINYKVSGFAGPEFHEDPREKYKD